MYRRNSRLNSALAGFMSLTMLLWSVGPLPVLRAQPVSVPTLNTPAFQPTDLDPFLNSARNLESEAAWEAATGGGRFNLAAGWEAAVDAEIQTQLLSVVQTDAYNNNADYKDYLLKELQIQKQTAYAAWEVEADRIIERERAAFIANLGDRVEAAAESESDQTLQGVDPNQVNDAELSKEQLQWEKEFQSQVDFGWFQFQNALNDVQQRYNSFNQSLTDAELQFQQNQAAIHAYEQNIRTAIQSSVTGARSYVASNGLYHVENCTGSSCSVDMNTLNAAGLQLNTLLDSVQQGLDNATPLSVLAQQMQTFLEAEELQATTRKNYWNSIKAGSDTLVQQIGMHGLTGGQTASPPITLSPYSVSEMERVTTDGSDWMGMLVSSLSYPVKLVWEFYLRGGIASALDTYIQLNGENRTIVSASADVCGNSAFRGGHFFGEILSNMGQCYSTAGHRAFAYRSQSISNNKFAIVLEADLTIGVNYSWEDANAAFNETVWQGYENDLAPVLLNWRDQILPAIQNWEAQVAQYDQDFANWQLQAAQQRADADATFAQSQSDILQERNSFLNNMQAEYRKGRAQWASYDRQQAAASASGEAAVAAAAPATNAIPIALQSFANINYTLGKTEDSFRLDQKFLAASESNLPDAQNLNTALSAFQTAIQGSVNLATAETLDDKALTERQRVIDALKSQLETNSLADMSDDEIYAMVEESARKEGRTLERTKQEIVQGMRADAAGRVWVVEQRADGKLVAKRKMKVGIGVLREGGDMTSAADYLTPEEDQTLEIAPPKSMRLASTGNLFEEWNDNKILDEFQANTEEFINESQAKLKGASNLMREADAFQQHREFVAQENIKHQVKFAQALQSVITGVAQGASASAAWNQHWVGQVRGQVASAIEEATGFPAGLISPLLGGADIKTALGQYAEGVFWQNFQEFHNLPSHLSSAIQTWFNNTRSKAEFRKKRREAARLAPEDILLGPAGALTYAWRNSQYHKAGQVAMQAVETVGGILLNTVGNIIPGVGTAVYAGYMALKQAYLGSLNGGTIGAVTGAASGVANAFTSMVGVNVNAAYTFENGYSGSVGVGIDLGGGMNIGASVQLQEGEGVTGFGLNAGYGPENGFGGGIGLNFDNAGSFQGGSLNVGYNETEGLTNNVTQRTNYGGALNFARDGFTGVTASASRTTNTQANTGYRASHTLGAGLTMNFDGSYALNVNQSATAGDAARFGFNSYGAGSSDTYTFGRGQEFGVSQTITSSTGYSTRAQAEAFIEDQKEELRRRMDAEETSPEERAALQADIERLDQKQNIVNPERAKRQWAERRLQEMIAAGNLKPEEAAALLAAIERDPEFLNSDAFRNLLGEDDANVVSGGSRDSLWSEFSGAITDTVGGLFGFSSSDEGFVDENGNWHERTCFVAGTMVRVPDGKGESGGRYTRIENIRVGDLVLSWDESSGRLGYYEVLQTFVKAADRIYRIEYEDGTFLETTWNHPFYVEDLGWVEARALRAGDVSKTAHGKLRIRSISREARYETVFNFEVQDSHTYFVSLESVLVHNAPADEYNRIVQPRLENLAPLSRFAVPPGRQAYLWDEHGEVMMPAIDDALLRMHESEDTVADISSRARAFLKMANVSDAKIEAYVKEIERRGFLMEQGVPPELWGQVANVYETTDSYEFVDDEGTILASSAIHEAPSMVEYYMNAWFAGAFAKTGIRLTMAGASRLALRRGAQYTEQQAVFSIRQAGRSIYTNLSKKAHRYLDDLQRQTGVRVGARQRHLLADDLRSNSYSKLTKAQQASHRAQFDRVKNDLIREWEMNTGRPWPRYTQDIVAPSGHVSRFAGKPYDAHHIIESKYGGPAKWWNIHPARFPDQHQGGIHRAGGIVRELFP
jgi:hypothetical protein